MPADCPQCGPGYPLTDDHLDDHASMLMRRLLRLLAALN